MSTRAYEVINAVVRIEDKRYLELGAGQPGTFSRVLARERVGVDVTEYDPEHPVDYLMTTDEFFVHIAPTLAPFDVVFIDACHEAGQVWRDFANAWRHTRSGGVILLHDLVPACEGDASPSRCHDAFKVLLHLRRWGLRFLSMVVLDEDFGLTAVCKPTDATTTLAPEYPVLRPDDFDRWTYTDLVAALPEIAPVPLSKMIETIRSWMS